MTDGSGTATVVYTAVNTSGRTRVDATADGYTLVYMAAASPESLQERSTGDQHVIGRLDDYSIVAHNWETARPGWAWRATRAIRVRIAPNP